MGMDRACCELDIWCRPDMIFLDSTQVLQRYLTLDTIIIPILVRIYAK